MQSKLDDTTALSRALGRAVDLGRGQDWTSLPEDVPPERAYRFSEGKLLRVNRERRESRTGSLVEVAMLQDVLFAFIGRSLEAHSTVCVLEHPALKTGEEPERLRPMAFTLSGKVCFLPTAGQDRAVQQEAFRWTMTPWRGVGAICAHLRRSSSRRC